MNIMIRNRRPGEIPVLELYNPDIQEKRPMVLLFHGYLGRKEFILPQAYLLASHGFFVVAPDVHGHGEREGDKLANLMEAVLSTSKEVNFLIEEYADEAMADNTRVGISGYSMGGMITFSYISGPDNRVKAAAPIISTPDWVSIVKALSTKERLAEILALGIIEDESDLEQYLDVTKQIQPLNNYKMMKDTPLTMLCGEDDTTTPPDGPKKLYELLEPIFFDKEALKLKIYPKTGHSDNIDMNETMARWMTKYL